VRRPALLVALLGAAFAVLRRSRAARAERDLWHEATTTPDLR
jgi:hypothetical protein